MRTQASHTSGIVNDRDSFNRQMCRQTTWLKDSWLWLLERSVLSDRSIPLARPRALDVGCGPGYVMDILSDRMEVQGVDIDPDAVRYCTSRGLNATLGDGEELPFEDDSFDFVYCTFLLLWVKDPPKIVSEMKRVSRAWIGCLAEPDFGGRVSHPERLSELDKLIMDGMRKQGADPVMGRKLGKICASCGMSPQLGVHPGVWDIERLREESEGEWKWIEMTVDPKTPPDKLADLRKVWDEGLENKSLFQFNPIFYALSKK